METLGILKIVDMNASVRTLHLVKENIVLSLWFRNPVLIVVNKTDVHMRIYLSLV